MNVTKLSPRNVKRLGLIVVLLVVLIIAVEGSLTLLRRREVRAAISIESGLPTPTQTPVGHVPTPTAEGATPEPAITALLMTDDGSVLVRVNWMYNIGPRFPLTTIHALAVDGRSQIVASDQWQIDCGNSTLTCEGSTLLTLRFGVKVAPTGTPATATPATTPLPTNDGRWPIGEYSIVVTRTYLGFDPVEVTRERVVIAPSQP